MKTTFFKSLAILTSMILIGCGSNISASGVDTKSEDAAGLLYLAQSDLLPKRMEYTVSSGTNGYNKQLILTLRDDLTGVHANLKEADISGDLSGCAAPLNTQIDLKDYSEILNAIKDASVSKKQSEHVVFGRYESIKLLGFQGESQVIHFNTQSPSATVETRLVFDNAAAVRKVIDKVFSKTVIANCTAAPY